MEPLVETPEEKERRERIISHYQQIARGTKSRRQAERDALYDGGRPKAEPDADHEKSGHNE